VKKIVALVAATVALTACSDITGPDEAEIAARNAQAKADLEAATQGSGSSMKLAAN
jgi:hypothetical protein